MVEVTKIVTAVSKGLVIGKKFLINNAPIILGVRAGIGIVSSSVLVAHATAKSVRQIDEEEMKNAVKLTTKDKVKLCWKNYIPASLEILSCLGCAVGSNYLYIKESKRLSGVILGYETLFDQVKKKMDVNFVDEVKENLKKPNNVHVNDIKANMDEQIVPYHKNYIIDEEHVLCVEPFTRQRFIANKRVIDIYATKIQDMHLRKAADFLDTNLNDILYCLGLEEIDPIVGESVYWNFDQSRVISLDFESTLLDGEIPALKLKYYPLPDTSAFPSR